MNYAIYTPPLDLAPEVDEEVGLDELRVYASGPPLVRAEHFLATCPPAVQGQGGGGATLSAVRALIRSMWIAPDKATDLLVRVYNPRCTPPWPERNLRRMVASVYGRRTGTEPANDAVRVATDAGPTEDELHAAYSALLSALPLKTPDRAALHARGLTDEDIERLGYKTWEPTFHVADAVRNVAGPKYFQIPGVVRGNGGSLHPRGGGLAIPVRDERGRILGLRVRVHMPVRNKKGIPVLNADGTPKVKKSYLWVSGRSDAPGDARATARVHVPLHAASRETMVIGVTEGEIKADIASALGSFLYVSVPGVGSWRLALEAARTLRAEVIVLAFDADMFENTDVANAVLKLSEAAGAAGLEVAIQTWDRRFGKGIDDVLVGGNGDAIKMLNGSLAEQFLDPLAAKHGLARHSAEARALDELCTNIDETGEDDAAIVSMLEAAFPESPPTDAAPVTGRSPLRLGDHVELRDRVLADITGGAPDRLVHDLGQFYLYDDGLWSPLAEDVIINAITLYSGVPVARRKDAPLSVTEPMTRGAVRLLRASVARPGYFRSAPAGVAFRDSFVTINPKTGEVQRTPHDRSQRVRVRYDFEYKPGAFPERFYAFLLSLCVEKSPEETFATIECILGFLGASLAGLATRFEKMIFSVGTGGTGNSTLREIITDVMPAGSVVVVPPAVMADPVWTIQLADALLNAVDDLPLGELMDTGTLKSAVTGGDLSGRRLYRDPISFRSLAGHWFSTNKLPSTRDVTGGFRRRPIVLEFKTPIPEADKIRGLRKEIVHEEQAAIVACALDALARAIQRNSLLWPASSDLAVSEWIVSNDNLGAFIEEQLVALGLDVSKDEWMTPDDLYKEYADWASSSGVRNVQNKLTFGRDMKARLHVSSAQCHTKQGTRYPVRRRRDIEQEEQNATLMHAMDNVAHHCDQPN